MGLLQLVWKIDPNVSDFPTVESCVLVSTFLSLKAFAAVFCFVFFFSVCAVISLGSDSVCYKWIYELALHSFLLLQSFTKAVVPL